ncbi:MAG: hypothetical protein ACLFTH_03115 [Candidatus Woesearchaeota archaeon]
MGLTSKKEEQLRKMPNVESVFSKSKDGKYLIHRTIITTVRPVEYFEKVLDSSTSEEPEAITGEELAAAQAE